MVLHGHHVELGVVTVALRATCQNRNFSVFGSNLATPAWYIMPSQRLPSLSTPRSRLPVGKPFLNSGIAYSVCLPVFGSSLPRNCSPKLEYHACPSTMTTSCGSIVARGRSYSVMTTLVPRPLMRGSVLSSYSKRGPLLRLMVARY